jgi:dihydrolipoamide dehydrogenase
VAVGRRPNGDRIGADAAGLRVDEHGFVPVDDQQRTNLRHVYAIGDVARAPLLAHKASHEGKIAAEVIAGLPSAFDGAVIPSVAYTDPELAWVGLGEADAQAAGVAVDVSRFPWQASGRALGMGRAEGLTKLLFARETGRLVGAGIGGPHAGELISECALAIELGADAEDLALTVHPHPTLSETIAFAAEIAAGTITDLYLPKRRRR